MIFANQDNHVRDSKSLIKQNVIRKGKMIGMYNLVFMSTASNSSIPLVKEKSMRGNRIYYV